MELQLEDRIHPLLLPNIVAVLAKHLHSKDVVSCRLVCRTWNDVIRKKSCPMLNPRIVFLVAQFLDTRTVHSARAVCSLWNDVMINTSCWSDEQKACFLGQVGSDDFVRFGEKFGDLELLPLPLAFTNFYASNNVSLGDPTTNEFLRKYGSCLRSVSLYRCKWDLEDLRGLLFEQARSLEHLRIVCGILPGTQVGQGKKLRIPELSMLLHEDPADPPLLPRMKSTELDFNVLDTKDQPRAYVEQFLTELFASCPNLESFNMDVSAWYARTWATNFIASNDGILLPNLHKLMYLIDPDLACVMTLQLKQLPLTTLRIRIRHRDVTLEALHQLLRSLKHTLTDLQVIFIDYACAHEFPSSSDLYKLRNLELWKFKGQLDFLKELVNLRELLIGEMELKKQNLFNHRDVFKLLLPQVQRITFKDFWETRVFS